MKRKLLVIILFVLVIIFSPHFVDAHVKWFTEVTPEKEEIEHILSPLFMTISILIAALLAVLTQLLPMLDKIPITKKIDDVLDRYRKSSRYILKYGTAIALIIQVLAVTIFAPEFAITNQTIRILMWITIILLLIPFHFA